MVTLYKLINFLNFPLPSAWFRVWGNGHKLVPAVAGCCPSRAKSDIGVYIQQPTINFRFFSVGWCIYTPMSLLGSGRAGKSQFGVIWRHVAADANFVISDTTSVISDTKSLVRRHEIRGWAHVFREGTTKDWGRETKKGGGEKTWSGGKTIFDLHVHCHISIKVFRFLTSYQGLSAVAEWVINSHS